MDINLETKIDNIVYYYKPLTKYELIDYIKKKFTLNIDIIIIDEIKYYKYYVNIIKIINYEKYGKIISSSRIFLECSFVISYFLLPLYTKDISLEYKYKAIIMDKDMLYRFKIYDNIYGSYLTEEELDMAKEYYVYTNFFKYEKPNFECIINKIEDIDDS